MGNTVLAFVSPQSAEGDLGLALRKQSPVAKADPTFQFCVEDIDFRKVQSDRGNTAPALS